jgi:tRNA uridine 5-carboxymethylaminomethyl modification enzyme
MTHNKTYDIIVVGAGHAGTEAALACSRLGCQTLLITFGLDKLGLMSCNPAIGGVGKGHLVKEIDALGGEMAKAADACGIQFKILNRSKGAAVHSSRAQIDRKKYAAYIQAVLKKQKGLTLYAAEVSGLICAGQAIKGVRTHKGEEIFAKAVILTPGTFLNGLIHLGMQSFPGGRLEEKQASSALSDSLRQLGFQLLRFKTGTCARLDAKSIDFAKLIVQKGDAIPQSFSFSTKRLNLKQVPCYLTYTNAKTHAAIRKNLGRSPLYSGKIIGTGVRYCPSLEDKVVKFPHHERHQVFLEPETLEAKEYYPNGLSTSLPEDVQAEFIHSIAGLEKVKINRFGYGIEHDVVEPRQLLPTLETKRLQNLYLAGQINGTTGYEEAGAQGLLAGINAALKVKAKPALILDRASSYLGVLVDDLVTKGTSEPYRMFTSRVEYRLLIREDNTDLRLRKIGYAVGLVSKSEYAKTLAKAKQIEAGIKYLKENKISLDSKKVNLYQYLKRPQIKIAEIKKDLPKKYFAKFAQEIETEVKYSGFIQRQLAEVKSFKSLEKMKIPQSFDYALVNGLSREIKEKLSQMRPLNLGQASRISGVTPAAITILMIYLKSRYQVRRTDTRVGYYHFSHYLKHRFGCQVYKVSLDAGFTCPNRDGKLSRAGCIYCDNRSFSFHSRSKPLPLEKQIQQGIEFGRKRYAAEKFLAYFQAYTNTYAPLKELKAKYDCVKKFPEVVGIAIGTRPDCVDEKILDLICEYADDYEVWLEYGLQSIHAKTLKLINRNHTFQDFLKAVEMTRKKKLKICAHVIIGLPGESREEILETAQELGKLKIEAVKLHPLHIIKGTKLEEMYREKNFHPLTLDEYADLACAFLERLWPETVIERLGADCPKELLVAPAWILEKEKVLATVEKRLAEQDSFQGRLYGV